MNRLSIIFCIIIIMLTTSLTLIGCAGNSGSSNSSSDSDEDQITPLDPSINIFINQVETVCPSEIRAYVTVIDEDGEWWQNLSVNNNNFTLRENNTPLSSANIDFYNSAEIAEGSLDSISISIIMDYSGSMIEDETTKTAMEDAVVDFIELMNDDDQAEVIKFNTGIQDQTDLLLTDAAGKSTLINFVRNNEVETGQTYLYDTLYIGIEDLMGETGRKAVVAITDGEENPNENYVGDGRTKTDVINLSTANDVPLFILGLGADIDQDLLLEMTEATSGHYYQAASSTDLADIYGNLSDFFHDGQYLFIFDGTPDGEENGQLTIFVSNDSGSLTDSATTTFSYDCP